MAINVLSKRIRRCGYCRHEVLGEGIRHNGVLYHGRVCRELGIDAIERNEKKPLGWGWLSAIALFCLFGIAVQSIPAWAHDQYMDWRQPGYPQSSCCNGHKTEDGVETGDCAVTSAKWEKNHWWAFIAKKKIWIQVPDDRIVNYKTDDVDAHLCYSEQYGNVYCFRPPKLGM